MNYVPYGLQGNVLQSSVPLLVPSQGAVKSPYEVSLQSRVRHLTPVPQVALHLDQPDHDIQSPGTIECI